MNESCCVGCINIPAMRTKHRIRHNIQVLCIFYCDTIIIYEIYNSSDTHTHTHTLALALALALTHTRTHRHIHTHTHRHSIYSILSRCFGPLPAILIYLICYLILIYLICGIYKFTYIHIYTFWHTNFLM